MTKVAASLLNVEEENAITTFYNLETAKIDYFHIDVMDGKFVENNTVERMEDYAVTISNISNLGLDIHLMVEDIEAFVEEFTSIVNPEIISFHYEASKDKTMNIINLIKEEGIKVGLAINPDTKIDEIKEYLPYLHMVLVMTVVAGKGGQKLIPECLDKVKELRKYLDENGIDIDIEVDGGINGETGPMAKDAGADILVAGVFLVHANDQKEAVQKLK